MLLSSKVFFPLELIFSNLCVVVLHSFLEFCHLHYGHMGILARAKCIVSSSVGFHARKLSLWESSLVQGTARDYLRARARFYFPARQAFELGCCTSFRESSSVQAGARHCFWVGAQLHLSTSASFRAQKLCLFSRVFFGSNQSLGLPLNRRLEDLAVLPMLSTWDIKISLY